MPTPQPTDRELAEKIKQLRRALLNIASTPMEYSDSDRSSCDEYIKCPLCQSTGNYKTSHIRHKNRCPIIIARTALL